VSPTYHIRRAERHDTESLQRLSSLWAAEGCTRGYQAFGKGDDRPGKWFDSGYLWVAEQDGLVVGFVAGVAMSGSGPVFKPEGERFLHIHELYVEPSHRRHGVGRRLVDAILDQAMAAGIHRSIVASGNIDWRGLPS
jgi:GNAT superfamily N-acetyltransferase